MFEELIKQFFEKYGDDPVGFVRDVLHVEPDLDFPVIDDVL